MKSKRSSFLLATTSMVLLLFILELMGRSVLCFVMKYPFWQPSRKFYSELEKIRQVPVSQNDDKFDILILGGSAMSIEFGLSINKALDSLLDQPANGRKVQLFNAATPAHTSLDNLNKYRLLGKQRFDLVIYYEAINETRANNIPKQYFLDDYRHILWYYDLNLVKRHPEINWTVLPFIAHKSFNLVIDKLKGKKFMEFQSVNPDYVKFGKEIKTEKPYHHNVDQIVIEAQKRKEKIMLMTYALYVPPSVRGNGGYTDYRDFAGCPAPSPLWLWGDPENVQAGVNRHNEAIRQIAAKRHTYFLDMDQQMPRDRNFYCDLCHMTDSGGKEFANKVYQYITTNQLLAH
jgi:hypothetical protein